MSPAKFVTPVTEYFYVRASTIPDTDAPIFGSLANKDLEKAHENAEEAMASFKQEGREEADVAAVMATRAQVAICYGEVNQANELAEGAKEKAAQADNKKVQAAAMNVMAQVMIVGSPADAVSKAEEALEVARKTGDVHVMACVNYTLAMAMVASGSTASHAKSVGFNIVNLFAGSDALGEGCALLCQSEIQIAVKDFTAALNTARKAAEVLERTNDMGKHALAMYLAATAALAQNEIMQSDYDAAFDAIELIESLGSLGNRRLQISLKLDVANAKIRDDKLVEAEDLAEEALQSAKGLPDTFLEAESCKVLATTRLAIATESANDEEADVDTNPATEAARDALVLYKKLGDRNGEATMLYKLGQVRYQAGAGDMAKMAAEEAQTMFRELGDSTGEAGCLLLIAHAMHSDDMLEAARRAANKALSLYQTAGDDGGVQSCTEFLEKVQTSQSKKARETKEATKTVSDSGLVKLVTNPDDANHLLSFLAEMNDDEDTELSEFNLSAWSSQMLPVSA